MNQFINIILIALFVEAIVETLKPIWQKGEGKMTVAEYVAMGIGVLLAVACRINMLGYVVEIAYPGWVEYIFYVMTGIAMGRGTNFLYDLWTKLKEWQTGQLLEGVKEAIPENAILDGEEIDLEITHWPLEMIIAFARDNGLPTPSGLPVDPEDAKAYLINYIFPDTHTEEAE